MGNEFQRVVGVIPARLNSIRFPGKILALINGLPMVMLVAERALQAQLLDEVIIAVDSEEVRKKLKNSKIKVVMTSSEHSSGSDRVAEVVKEQDVEIVVNIQGDEPMLDPVIIDKMVYEFREVEVQMVTSVSTEISPEDFLDTNTVKVLLDEHRNATAFQRILKQKTTGGWYRHIGVYAFRKETLLYFTGLPQSINEQKYGLEQLRALDNGISIRAVVTHYPYRGVDTEKDLGTIRQMCEVAKS